MHRTKPNVQFVDTLTQLATAAASTVSLANHLLDAVKDRFDLDLAEHLSSGARSPRNYHGITDGRPIADSASYTVVWRGKTCFLGNSLPFRLFEQLACRPNRYFSHDELLDDVWQGCRTPDAVRSVVKVLRRKLREADMDDLASAIKGNVRNHLGLTLASGL